MNASIGDRKSSGYSWREAAKMCLSGDCQQARSQDGMAAVAASGSEYDGGN